MYPYLHDQSRHDLARRRGSRPQPRGGAAVIRLRVRRIERARRSH